MLRRKRRRRRDKRGPRSAAIPRLHLAVGSDWTLGRGEPRSSWSARAGTWLQKVQNEDASPKWCETSSERLKQSSSVQKCLEQFSKRPKVYETLLEAETSHPLPKRLPSTRPQARGHAGADGRRHALKLVSPVLRALQAQAPEEVLRPGLQRAETWAREFHFDKCALKNQGAFCALCCSVQCVV